jgi:hypothetical protein
VQRLEEIAGMTRDEAREHLLREVEDEASHVIGLRIKELRKKPNVKPKNVRGRSLLVPFKGVRWIIPRKCRSAL